MCVKSLKPNIVCIFLLIEALTLLMCLFFLNIFTMLYPCVFSSVKPWYALVVSSSWQHFGAVSCSLCFWEAKCLEGLVQDTAWWLYLLWKTGSVETPSRDQQYGWLEWLEGGTERGPGLGVFLFKERGKEWHPVDALPVQCSSVCCLSSVI